MAQGGLVYPIDHAKITVMLMGDSNGSICGNALKQFCKGEHYNLVVVSVGAHDTSSFFRTTKSALGQSLDAVTKYNPDCVVIANQWVDKLRNNTGRLRMALEEIAPHTKQIILMTQPPFLPIQSIRQAIRDGIALPLKENEELRAERKTINDLIYLCVRQDHHNRH